MNIGETANAGELLWVAIGLMVGTVNGVLWIIATRDLRAVYRARQNGAKRIEAWTWFYAHGLLVLAQCIGVSIGIYAALTPPANPATPVTRVSIVLAFGLIAMQLTHGVLGVFLILRRGKLDTYIDGQMHAHAVVIPVGRITVQQAVDEAASRRESGIPDDV